MAKQMPTNEQLDALGNFAANEGRTWKAALRHAWETGDYPTGSDSASLQQLRNTYGPGWLMAFNVRSVGARYKASDMRQHGYGCACADCGVEREDRKANDRQDCETPAGMESARVAARAMVAEQEKPIVYLSCQYCHKPAGDRRTKEQGICHDCKQKMVDEGHAWEENKSAHQRRADIANVHSFTERNA